MNSKIDYPRCAYRLVVIWNVVAIVIIILALLKIVELSKPMMGGLGAIIVAGFGVLSTIAKGKSNINETER